MIFLPHLFELLGYRPEPPDPAWHSTLNHSETQSFKKNLESGIVAYTFFNPITWEAKAGESLRVWGHPCSVQEFQDS